MCSYNWCVWAVNTIKCLQMMYRLCLRVRVCAPQNTNKHDRANIRWIQLYDAGSGYILHLFNSIWNFQRIQCVCFCVSTQVHGACGFFSKRSVHQIYFELAIHYLRFFPSVIVRNFYSNISCSLLFMRINDIARCNAFQVLTTIYVTFYIDIFPFQVLLFT